MNLYISMLFATVLGLVSIEAQTCSCAPKVSVREAYDMANIVVSARVLKVEDEETRNPPWGSKAITLETIKNWKGLAWQKQVILRTNVDEAACGFMFQEDQDYLIYAYVSPDGFLETNWCTRTTLLTSAQKDLDSLKDIVGDN